MSSGRGILEEMGMDRPNVVWLWRYYYRHALIFHVFGKTTGLGPLLTQPV
jgi:hypothetical protein